MSLEPRQLLSEPLSFTVLHYHPPHHRLKTLLDPDLSLQTHRFLSLTAHGADLRVKWGSQGCSLYLASTLRGPSMPPAPKPQFHPALPRPTPPGCGFLSVLTSPEGEALFVESAILISHTELLGFLSGEGGGEAGTGVLGASGGFHARLGPAWPGSSQKCGLKGT